jgi:hypothetical protein
MELRTGPYYIKTVANNTKQFHLYTDKNLLLPRRNLLSKPHSIAAAFTHSEIYNIKKDKVQTERARPSQVQRAQWDWPYPTPSLLGERAASHQQRRSPVSMQLPGQNQIHVLPQSWYSFQLRFINPGATGPCTSSWGRRGNLQEKIICPQSLKFSDPKGRGSQPRQSEQGSGTIGISSCASSRTSTSSSTEVHNNRFTCPI